MDENNDKFLVENYDKLCRFCLKKPRARQDYFNLILQNETVIEEFWDVFGIEVKFYYFIGKSGSFLINNLI
jgi:hypothetical protein